jgi:ssRNA-specific RNase YbeY (16S rRNA maturation enzyme)
MKKKWEQIKKKVLGKNFDLSVAFVDSSLMKKFNKIYRNKNKTANCLSFLYSKNNGEILINKINKKKADQLFIHSILHLRGFEHGLKMDKEEKKWQKIL